MAAQRTRRGVKAVRDGDLVIRKRNVRQLGTSSVDGVVDHVLRLVFQLVDSCIFCGFCGGIGFGLAGIGAFLTAERGGAGLGDLVVDGPLCRAIAAVQVVVVVLGVAVGGNGLRSGRTHLPAAAVYAAAGLAGCYRDDRAVHLFLGLQLVLVGVHGVGQIQAAAGGLGRGAPLGREIFRLRGIRDVGAFDLAGDLLADQRNDLPRIACGRVINVGVIAIVRSLCGNAAGDFFGGGNVGLGGVTVGVVLDDPLLGIIVDFVDKVWLFAVRAHNDRLILQHVKAQLAQTAPNIDLVGIVVAGSILAGFKPGHMGKIVGRAAIGLAVQAVAATVCLDAVEPHQPGAALFGNAGDFAGGKRRVRGGGVGGDACIRVRIQLGGRGIFLNLHVNRFCQVAAIRGAVDKLGSKIGGGFYVEAGGCRRLLGVGLVQDAGLLILGCGDEVGICRGVAQ